MRALSPALPAAAALVLLLPVAAAPLLVDERILFAQLGAAPADPLAWAALPLGGSGTWRPLTSLTFALDGGRLPALSHAVNLGLYAALVGVVGAWLRGRVGAVAAAAATAWFALHPAHLAIAGWVAGRADLLMVLLSALALLDLDRGRFGRAALWAGAAVLAKETAVALPLVALALGPPAAAGPRPSRSLAPLALSTAACFGATLLVARPDPSYIPDPANLPWLLRWWPLYALELPVPFFRPLGVGAGLRDSVGALLALPVAVAGTALALRSDGARTAGRSALACGAALLPVAHVLPNDGGQWYLALPTLALAPCVAIAAEAARRRLPASTPVFLAATGLLFASESLAWRAASVEVDARIEAARVVVAERGFEALPQPSRERPELWPHVGPSICCGLPRELFAPVSPAAADPR